MDVHAARLLLAEAEHALARDLPALERELAEVLVMYRGIPSAIDVFEILNLHGDEDRHTAFLAWLLDPAGSHGIADRFLRTFLLQIAHPTTETLSRASGPLRAWIRPWLALGPAGVPDLTMVVEDSRGCSAAIVIEAKIHAPLTLSPQGAPQTTRYFEALNEPQALENRILKPCRDASELRALASMDLVFVFLRADPSQQAEPTDKESPAKEQRYRNVDYQRLERALAVLAMESDLAPNVLALVQQFRTSLLAGALPEAASLTALSRLRQLRDTSIAAPAYRKAQHLREALGGFGRTNQT